VGAAEDGRLDDPSERPEVALGDEARAQELVREHLRELQDLTRNESVLFEPRRGAPTASEPREGDSYLPARVEDLGGKGRTSVGPGDVLVVETPGGGGYGTPE